MIQSIIDSAKDFINYDINIICKEMDETNYRNLVNLSNKSNISIRIHNIKEEVECYKFYTTATYTNTDYKDEIYYRLLIPSLMPNYDKVLYLDGDMVVLSDISELYNEDVSNYLIGGTRDYSGIAACYDHTSDRVGYRKTILGDDYDMDSYIISCLILFNIKEFNKTYGAEQILDIALSKNWLQHDQDVINVLCKGRIKILDGKWAFFEEQYSAKFLNDNLMEELIKARDDVKIIHYAAANKAWIKKDSQLNRYFWLKAAKTPYFDVFNGKLGNDVLYRYAIFKMVLGMPVQYYYTFSSVVLLSQPQLIGSLEDLEFHLTKMEMVGNHLFLQGYFECIRYNDSEPSLSMIVNDKWVSVETIKEKSTRVLDSEIRIFNVTLDVEEMHIRFDITYDGIHHITPTYIATDQFTPLNENTYSYYCKDGMCIRKVNNCRELELKKIHNTFALEKQLIKSIKQSKKRLTTIRRVYRVLKMFNLTSRKVLLFLENDSDRDIIQYIRQRYPSKKIVIGSRNNIKDSIYVLSKDYQISYLQSDVIVSSVYDYYAFFPFMAFDRSDEIRDIVHDKKHILVMRDADILELIDNPYYKIDEIITTKKLLGLYPELKEKRIETICVDSLSENGDC